jgi:ABC-type multidrug transport system fused ATPase/permease subunit
VVRGDESKENSFAFLWTVVAHAGWSVCSLYWNPQSVNQAGDDSDNEEVVVFEDIIKVSETFQPHMNDGYALIQSVTTSNGKKLLHEMKVLMPEGSVTAILGPSGAGKSTLLNTLTDSLSINSTAVADST